MVHPQVKNERELLFLLLLKSLDIFFIDICRDTLIKPIRVEIEGFEKDQAWTQYVCKKGKSPLNILGNE